MLHLVPVQRSASVNGPEGVKASPAAVQAERDEHETPLKKCPWLPGGVGVAWTLQADPFHRSARSFEAVFPAATQAEEEVQETADRKDPGLFEVGVGWMRQPWPSQRSVIVPTGLPELSKPATPTAMQVDADVHETPVKNPL